MNFGYVDDINPFYGNTGFDLKPKNKVNIDDADWVELVKIINNPRDYNAHQINYASYYYRVSVDIYNGINIDINKANAELDRLYKELPDNLKWR